MLRCEIIHVSIQRPFGETYAALREPKNYRLWSPVPDTRLEPRGNDGLDWLVDLPQGEAILRYTPYNRHGILDYQVLDTSGNLVRSTPMRLVPNGTDGCELVVVYMQRPGQADDAFNSALEWARTDFISIKTTVEALIDAEVS